jgi:hypothetical protein
MFVDSIGALHDPGQEILIYWLFPESLDQKICCFVLAEEEVAWEPAASKRAKPENAPFKNLPI